MCDLQYIFGSYPSQRIPWLTGKNNWIIRFIWELQDKAISAVMMKFKSMTITPLIISLLVVNGLQDIERICESNHECIPIARCPSIAKKHSEFLFLHSNGNKFSVEYQTLRRELQKSVCNRDKKGVCCTLEQDLSNYIPRLGNCGVPKRGLPKVSENFSSTEHLHFWKVFCHRRSGYFSWRFSFPCFTRIWTCQKTCFPEEASFRLKYKMVLCGNTDQQMVYFDCRPLCPQDESIKTGLGDVERLRSWRENTL